MNRIIPIVLCMLSLTLGRADAVAQGSCDSILNCDVWNRIKARLPDTGDCVPSLKALSQVIDRRLRGYVVGLENTCSDDLAWLSIEWMADPAAPDSPRIHIDKYEREGTLPGLRFAFLANADLDPAPELIIQVAWHYDDANAIGKFYKRTFYRISR